MNELQLKGEADMRYLAIAVNYAKNSRVQVAGQSAYSFAFGREPRVPDSLLNEAS